MTATPLSLKSGGLGQNLWEVEGVPNFPGNGEIPTFDPGEFGGSDDVEDDFDATGEAIYELSEAPHSEASVLVIVQGQVVRKGTNNDYVYESVGNRIVFRDNAIPEVGMWVLIRYRQATGA
jgi:hypothetical protein